VLLRSQRLTPHVQELTEEGIEPRDQRLGQREAAWIEAVVEVPHCAADVADGAVRGVGTRREGAAAVEAPTARVGRGEKIAPLDDGLPELLGGEGSGEDARLPDDSDRLERHRRLLCQFVPGRTWV